MKKTPHETESLLRIVYDIYRKSKGSLTQREIGEALGLRAGTIYVNKTFRKFKQGEPIQQMNLNNLAVLREYVKGLQKTKGNP